MLKIQLECMILKHSRGVTWGNPQHLSAYMMDMLDVGRHICASTWVIMVTIAPRGLGQGDDAGRR